jgi:hypothetical protein
LIALLLVAALGAGPQPPELKRARDQFEYGAFGEAAATARAWIAAHPAAEVDDAVEALSSLMEPMIMVVLGTLIGGLVIAMYLPIFSLISKLTG